MWPTRLIGNGYSEIGRKMAMANVLCTGMYACACLFICIYLCVCLFMSVFVCTHSYYTVLFIQGKQRESNIYQGSVFMQSWKMVD